MVGSVAVPRGLTCTHLRANRAERCPIRLRRNYRQKGQGSDGEPNSGSHALPWGESGLIAGRAIPITHSRADMWTDTAAHFVDLRASNRSAVSCSLRTVGTAMGEPEPDSSPRRRSQGTST